MKPNFKDSRGEITDLMVSPKYSITHISFTKGSIRGNHYHKKTVQTDIVLSGSVFVMTKDYTGKKFALVLRTGDTITHPPMMQHAYKALSGAAIVSVCWGVRKGNDYEKDVFRLKGRKKLLS